MLASRSFLKLREVIKKEDWRQEQIRKSHKETAISIGVHGRNQILQGQRNGTVSVCHTKTKDINKYIKQADILIVAVGQPRFITKDKIKDGVVIIDVGINRVEGKLVGDVDFEDVLDKCSKITPVPGGVGPLTVSFLLHNTFFVYKKQLNI